MEAAVKAPGGAEVGRDAGGVASVVVPCFNGGRYLDALMAAFARQTLKGFEIIIVDDGSTDQATLQKLAALEGRARVIHQDNRGLSAARNTGIEAARTEFVAVLDCDDTFEPPFLEEALALMQNAPPEAALVFSHMRLTGVANGLVERHFNAFDLLFSNTMHSAVMLRKTCWRAVGGYDETMRQGYEDWEFYLRLAQSGYYGIEIPEIYFNYAIASDGMLFSRSSQVHAALWRSMRLKHAALYRPLAILKLWWRMRNSNRHVSLAKAVTALVLTTVLPDAWYSRMIVARRRRKLLEGHLPVYRPKSTRAGLMTNALH